MFQDISSLLIRALYIGDQIDVRQLEKVKACARNPLTLMVEQEAAYVTIFRYGVVVMFNVKPQDEAALMREIMLHTKRPLDKPVVEESELSITTTPSDTVADNIISVFAPTVEKLQIIADAMAKSVILEFYELEESRNLERISPLAEFLHSQGRTGAKTQELLKQIGKVLLNQQIMVGRVEVGEKPDLLWDFPELERFYLRLSDEFEIRERDKALERKMEIISRTSQTVLDIITAKRSLRVEWYIVILIVFEILLTLYELFFTH